MYNRLIKNPCNIYLLFWCAYLLQGTLYPSGGLLSQGLLVIILVLSIRHTLLVLGDKSKPRYFTGLLILLSMHIIYGLVLFATDGATTNGLVKRPPTYFYLKSFLISLLPIFSFYYYVQKGHLNQRVYRQWVAVFLIVAILEFFRIQRESLLNMAFNDEGITNNGGYVMLSLIPCFLVFRKSWQQLVCILTVIVFVMASMKRGAILTTGIVVFAYLFQHYRSLNNWERLFYFVSILIAGLIGLSIFKDTLLTNDYFNLRVQQTLEGDSSGRNDIYRYLIDYYKYSTSFFHQLVGLGADGTIKISPKYAHNDWLEVLINQGLLGIVVMLVYWTQFVKTCRNKAYSIVSHNVLLLILILTFIRTLFSMSIGDNSVYLTSALGFALADGYNSNNI